jgi:hypothetical protein
MDLIPGLSLRSNPGLCHGYYSVTTLKGLAAHTPNPFKVVSLFIFLVPRVVAALQPLGWN